MYSVYFKGVSDYNRFWDFNSKVYSIYRDRNELKIEKKERSESTIIHYSFFIIHSLEGASGTV